MRGEIGIVVALPAEAATLGVRHLHAGGEALLEHGWLAVAGIGHERAVAAARRLMEQGARALISWGVAGAVLSALRAGDLLLPRRVLSANESWVTDAQWREQIARAMQAESRVHVVTDDLYCSRSPVLSIVEKHALAERGAAAVDMESAAVAMVAARAGVPFVAIKAICDEAETAIAHAAMAMLDIDGRLSWRAAAKALRAGPRAWRDLAALRAGFAAARRTLSRAAQAMPRGLPS